MLKWFFFYKIWLLIDFKYQNKIILMLFWFFVDFYVFFGTIIFSIEYSNLH